MDAYAAFRYRDFRLLLTASLFQNLGVQMLSAAVSWDLYMQTRSAAVLGNVGLVQVAPSLLFSLFAGHLADRRDRRRILILAQALTLIATLPLAIGLHSVPWIYACLFLIASARTLQLPSRSAIVPEIVPVESLANAVTWNSTIFEIASISGPAAAGILLAVTQSRTIYRIQVFCILLVLVCVLLLNYRGRRAAPSGAAGLHTLLEGFHFIWNHKLILPAVSLDMFAVLFGGATALLPIYAVDILHAGPSAFGWLRAAPSMGAVLMAVTLAHSRRIHQAGKTLLWSVASFGAATIAFGLSRNILLSFAMLLLIGAFDNVSVVLRQSLVQTGTPNEVRGRVMAVTGVFISCSNQLGAAESGWTAAWFGATGSVAGGGAAAILIVAACAMLSPAIRRWRQ